MMGSRLNVEVQESGGVEFVTLTGVIDEDNNLTEVTSRISGSTVVINSAGVERINSCGVRDWVNWLAELDAKGVKYHLSECSPAMMTHVNSVNNFVGEGSILSFFAPYYCPSCEEDKMFLIQVADAVKAQPFETPVCRCDQCDHTMEFDDIESSYFDFLGSKKLKPVDPRIAEAATRYFAVSTKVRSRTQSISISTGSVPSSPSATTTPSSRNLRGLLTDAYVPAEARPAATPAPAAPRVMLYLIVGILLVALGLLGYLAVRLL